MRRRCPWSVSWLQSFVVHRAHHLGDVEGFVETQVCWETLGDSCHWHSCAPSEMPSPHLFLLLLFKINLWRVCWVVFTGEQNLSFLAGTHSAFVSLAALALGSCLLLIQASEPTPCSSSRSLVGRPLTAHHSTELHAPELNLWPPGLLLQQSS